MKRPLFAAYRTFIRLFAGSGISRIYPINIWHRWFMRTLQPESAAIHGMKMFLDPKDSLGLAFPGVYEPFETALIKARVNEGNIVLDIGANIGYYTLLFSRLVGRTGRVFAFEPEPRNFAILRRNVEENGLENVVLLQQAVANKKGKTRLHVCEENWGDHRIVYSGDDRDFCDVETITMDEFLAERGVLPDFVKMDIQGSEGLALEGMAGTLAAGRPMHIVTEFWPKAMEETGCRVADFLERLTSQGFRVHNIDEKLKKLQPTSAQQLAQMRQEWTNLLCVRDGAGRHGS